MSTRSYICIQEDANKYKGIYCHNDGYLALNGAILQLFYSDREKVEELIKLGDNSVCIMFGTVKRWNGRINVSKFINSLNSLINPLQELDNIKIYDTDGHLYISSSHHDRDILFEIKKLTSKGLNLALKHNLANDKELHNTIINCNLYSKLAKLFSRKII